MSGACLTGSSLRVARTAVWVAGLFSVLGGTATLVGWMRDEVRLTDWLGLGISMFPNAALGAIAAGLALLLLSQRSRLALTAGRVLALLCALIGGLSLVQHVTGINLGIDTLLFDKEWGQAASASRMRIGVPASTSFLLIGTALLFAAHGSALARQVASALAVLPVAIASLSLTGYWFGANQLFGIGRLTGISWQTALIIAVLGLGLLASLPRNGLMALLCRDDPGGVVARRLLLPIVLIPFLLGWLRIEGQELGWFDANFGTAIRTLAEIGLYCALLWWTANGISRQAEGRRLAVEALQASEDRFSRFMSFLPGLAWIKDASGRYLYVNDTALRAIGVKAERVLGARDADFLPAEVAAAFAENDRRAVESDAGIQAIEAFTHSDGEHRSLLVTKFPIPNPDGGAPLIGGIGIDVTDRLRAEEALRDAHRRKDEFLATLAHELRNPLAPIRYAVQFFKGKVPPGAEVDEALDIVERQVQQMARLLDDLLDTSRVLYGKLTLRPERVDLATVLARAVEASRPLFDAGRQHLTVDLPREPLTLSGDPARLAQVFSNLLNNAAKYSPAGARVRLSAEHRDGEVVVSVKDNGTGIAPELLPRIFDMFAQAKGANSGPHPGLGIGLSLVRGLVALHGGRVEARSDGPNRGSEFLVHLPVTAPAPEPAPSFVPPAETTPRDPGRCRILVADDLRDSANAIAAIFRAEGHAVEVAYDGYSALQAAATFHPQVALLDIGMPGLNGYEVCRRLREANAGSGDPLLIVAITGWGQSTDRQLAIDAGFDQHLVKPVSVADLRNLLNATPAAPSVPPGASARP